MSTRGAIVDRTVDTSGSIPGGGGATGVPNLAALTAVNDGALQNGTILGVGTMQDTYRLNKTSTQAASGVDYVATASGVGIWERSYSSGDAWTNEIAATPGIHDWYVKASTGNDENSGTAASPLATSAEVHKRLGSNPLLADHYINLVEPEVNAQRIAVNFGPGPYRTLRYVGARAYLNPAQAASAVTPYSAATSQADVFTSAALPVSWTASGFVGKLGEITSGVATGCVFRVMVDNGAKAALVSRPINPSTLAQGQPVAADNFRMFDCTRLGGDIYIACTGNGAVEFVDVDCTFGGTVIESGSVFFLSSYVNDCTNSSGYVDMIGSSHTGRFHNLSSQGSNIDGGGFERVGGSAIIVDQGGIVVFFNAAMVTTNGIEVSAGGYLYALDSVMVYNTGSDGILIDAGIVEMGSNVALFGTGNAGRGVKENSSGQLLFRTRKPTITGTLGDALVGGLDIDWSMAPFTNPNELASIRDLDSQFIGADYAVNMALMLTAGLMPH